MGAILVEIIQNATCCLPRKCERASPYPARHPSVTAMIVEIPAARRLFVM
jgi:hypothetical protein